MQAAVTRGNATLDDSRLVAARWTRPIKHELQFPLGCIPCLEGETIRLTLNHGSDKGVVQGSVVSVHPLIASPKTYKQMS
jgi:hypothetical protein